MPAKEKKPNVVLIFIDDMGWADLSCFGNTDIQNPNIHKLASEGIRFNQFYVNSPICFPSRVAILYSRPPDRKNFYGFENLPSLAVREGNWKLLCDYDGDRPKLYHMVDDPGEQHNLAAAHPEQTAAKVRQVTSWYRSMPVLS